jgi:hypothetical protein
LVLPADQPDRLFPHIQKRKMIDNECVIHAGKQMWVFSLAAVVTGMMIEEKFHWMEKLKYFSRHGRKKPKP